MDKLWKRVKKSSAGATTSEVGPPDRGTTNTIQERFGLIPFPETAPLAHGSEQYPVDVIAVHGLNGDAFTTWTHENGILWLRDLLPTALPGSRVFTYGYPSQVVFSSSFAQVKEYARRLLSSVRDVQDERTRNQEVGGPSVAKHVGWILQRW